jgi:branched-chain amino acid transport system substrate-binding protein
MMTRRRFLGGAAAAAATLAVPRAPRAQVKEVLVGETHPLSGPFAREGTLGKQGIELAVNEINAAGGIKALGGARIRLLVLDNESKPPVAISTMEKLKDAGVVAVLGPYASGLAFVTTQEAEKYRIPHLLDVAIADQITERGFRYTFRFSPTAGMGARQTVDYLGGLNRDLRLGFKRAVLIHEDGLFGKATADTLQKLLPTIGMEVVERIPHNAQAPSLTNEVLKIKAARADVVIPSTYYPAHSLIIRTMAEQRVDTGAVVSVYGGAGSQYRFIKDVGKLADYMLDGNHWYNPRHPRIAAIIAAFERAYQQPFAYEWMLAYQSAWVLKDALERAGAADREKVRDALAKTGLQDAIVPYPIAFDDKGQNPHARALLMQVQSGRIAVVYPPDVAEAKPLLPVPPWDKRM